MNLPALDGVSGQSKIAQKAGSYIVGVALWRALFRAMRVLHVDQTRPARVRR